MNNPFDNEFYLDFLENTLREIENILPDKAKNYKIGLDTTQEKDMVSIEFLRSENTTEQKRIQIAKHVLLVTLFKSSQIEKFRIFYSRIIPYQYSTILINLLLNKEEKEAYRNYLQKEHGSSGV